MLQRVRDLLVGKEPAADSGLAPEAAIWPQPLALPIWEGHLDRDLTLWDAQVRLQLEAQRRAVEGRLADETMVLEALATLTARYAENGPWRAARSLFG